MDLILACRDLWVCCIIFGLLLAFGEQKSLEGPVWHERWGIGTLGAGINRTVGCTAILCLPPTQHGEFGRVLSGVDFGLSDGTYLQSIERKSAESSGVSVLLPDIMERCEFRVILQSYQTLNFDLIFNFFGSLFPKLYLSSGSLTVAVGLRHKR